MDHKNPIAPQYRTQGPVELILKEKKISLTGDSATVKTAAGEAVFKIKANLVSLSERRTLCDASSGQVVGQLRKKKLALIKSACYIGTEADEKVVTVVKKGILNPLKDEADIKLGDTVIGEARGDWRSKKIDVTIGGEPVMHISRKTNFTSIVLDSDSYCLKIEPGVDQAFMVLVCVAMDELYHDDD